MPFVFQIPTTQVGLKMKNQRTIKYRFMFGIHKYKVLHKVAKYVYDIGSFRDFSGYKNI